MLAQSPVKPARRLVVLLRGINIGSRNRVSMPRLRQLLDGAGYGEVVTHLQSGNLVLSSGRTAEETAGEVERLIARDLNLKVPVLVRTAEELAGVVRRDPLAAVASDPRLYQVTFLLPPPPRRR